MKISCHQGKLVKKSEHFFLMYSKQSKVFGILSLSEMLLFQLYKWVGTQKWRVFVAEILRESQHFPRRQVCNFSTIEAQRRFLFSKKI